MSLFSSIRLENSLNNLHFFIYQENFVNQNLTTNSERHYISLSRAEKQHLDDTHKHQCKNIYLKKCVIKKATNC